MDDARSNGRWSVAQCARYQLARMIFTGCAASAIAIAPYRSMADIPYHGGRKEGRSMSNRTVKYTAGEIGRVRVVEDFLPSPDALVPREENVKVTLSLSRRSVDFFKRAAKKRRVPYQRMIRALVDAYAERQALK